MYNRYLCPIGILYILYDLTKAYSSKVVEYTNIFVQNSYNILFYRFGCRYIGLY